MNFNRPGAGLALVALAAWVWSAAPAAAGLCVGTILDCASKTNSPLVLSIAFTPGSKSIATSAEQTLDAVAAALTDPTLAARRFVVESVSDVRSASRNYNVSLSRRRADLVMHYLLDRGVPASELTALGRGRAAAGQKACGKIRACIIIRPVP